MQRASQVPCPLIVVGHTHDHKLGPVRAHVEVTAASVNLDSKKSAAEAGACMLTTEGMHDLHRAAGLLASLAHRCNHHHHDDDYYHADHACQPTPLFCAFSLRCKH